mgnify:CR=1 FL=1
MRIAFLLSSLWLSGGVRVVVEYANHLARRGHRVVLATPGGTLDPDMERELEPGVSISQSRVARETRSGRDPGAMVSLAWSLAQAVPPSDVVVSTHTPTTVAGFLAGRVQRKGRLIWLYQDYEEMFLGRPAERWLLHHALRWHDAALVVSAYSREELLRFSPGNVEVVGEGLSHAELFRPLPAGSRPRSDGTQTILCLGDMRPRKGLSDFLPAAPLVYRQRPDIRLQIVSKAPCDIETPVPHEFIYRPDRAGLARLYATCDVFVLASWWESFGLPPLEAMACGAPVVLTDSRGVREYAQPGENCLLVPIRRPQALAAAILRVLDDPALQNRLRCQGPLTAARFDWPSAADRFEAALRRVVERADGPGRER